MTPVCGLLLQRRGQRCLSVVTCQFMFFVASTKGGFTEVFVSFVALTAMLDYLIAFWRCPHAAVGRS
jgi:hypothetical protein